MSPAEFDPLFELTLFLIFPGDEKVWDSGRYEEKNTKSYLARRLSLSKLPWTITGNTSNSSDEPN